MARVADPAELYPIKVDRWFGPMWLSFSSKLAGHVGIQHRGELRVPPFVPDRSADNERRRVAVICPEAALVWWSGATVTNKRGCLMAYVPGEDGHVGWYTELARTDAWRIGRTVCTTAAELARLAA